MVTIDPFSQAYSCLQNAPLSCKQPCETSKQVVGAKFCLACGFPATLPDRAEIRGRRGTYRILNFVRTQGMGRLYKGIQVSDGQPVVVKEYLLPKRCFNATQVQQRKNKFIQIAGASPIESQKREFRFVAPWEAIADEHRECCYLITQGEIAAAPTLAQVLKEQGAMSNRQVRKLLDQVLQTLQFLHTQKFRLPSGHVQSGLVHGNLTLESLVMSQNFYVFLCNLGSWERLFDPTLAQIPASDSVDDLVALGHIAFDLWTGQTSNSLTGHSLVAKDLSNCPQNDPPLKAFLYRLLKLDVPFASAGDARQALLQLSSPDQAVVDTQDQSSGVASTSKRRQWRYWLLCLLILPLLGAVIWCILPKRSSIASIEVEESNSFNHLSRSFTDVNGLKAGTYTYTSEPIGSWKTVLDKKPVGDRSVRSMLTMPKTDVAAVFKYTDYIPQRSLLDAVLKDNPRTQFAVMDLVDQLPTVMDDQVVGYDGLLVYVTAYKAYNLPSALHGQISLEQLRQIYTGQITNWQQINGNLPSLPIKPLRPTDPEALRLFQQKVLNNDPQLIAQFQKVKQSATFDTLRAIEQQEKQGQPLEAGLISFGILTRTWDQCKVYPLALSNGEDQPVQALLRETPNGKLQPITPSDNLCNEKQPFPNVHAFQSGSYPLSVPLIVAYPRDNSQPGYQSGPMFADLLKTQDGQYLLQQAGLVPLQPIPQDYQPSEAFANH